MENRKIIYALLAMCVLCLLVNIGILQRLFQAPLSTPINSASCEVYFDEHPGLDAEYNCKEETSDWVVLSYKNCGGGKMPWVQGAKAYNGDAPKDEDKKCFNPDMSIHAEPAFTNGDGYCDPGTHLSCDRLTCCCRSC